MLDRAGAPAAGLEVSVGDAVVIIGPDGYAKLPALGDTYDVMLFDGYSMFYAFVGMTSRAPVVRLPLSILADNGAVLHVHRPATLSATEDFAVSSHVVQTDGWTSRAFGRSNGRYSEHLYWAGSPDVTLTLEAFLYSADPATGSPLHYTGYATTRRSIHSGEVIDWTPEFSEAPFSDGKIDVVSEIPAGALRSVFSISMRQEGGARIVLRGPRSRDRSVSLVVPDLPNATFMVSLLVEYPNGRSSADARELVAGSVAHLTVSPPPVGLSPADGAAGVTTETEFSWTSAENAIYELIVTADGTVHPEYFIATAEPTARLPEGTVLGFPPPQAGRWSWFARSVLGVGSVDERAAGAAARGTASMQPRYFTMEP